MLLNQFVQPTQSLKKCIYYVTIDYVKKINYPALHRNINMNWYLRVLKKYATFEGRARRKEFWYFKLFHNLIIYACLLYGLYTVFSDPWLDKNADFFTILPKIFSPFLVLYLIATCLPNLAVSVRRLHDINRSAEYLLLWFIAPIGPLVLFIFHAMPGNPEDNKFGPDPITTPDPPPMNAAQKRRKRIASKQRPTLSPSQRARGRAPNYRMLPLQKRHQSQQRYQDSKYNAYDQPYDDNYHHDPQPYSQAPGSRKRNAMYELDQPVSNEGERYEDPFASNLSSQNEHVDEQLKRLGVIVDEPHPEKNNSFVLEEYKEEYEKEYEEGYQNTSQNPRFLGQLK